MIAFELEHVRPFMNRLLLSDSFDRFRVAEVSITTYASFHIDGHLHPEFFGVREDDEPPAVSRETLAAWKDLKLYCLSVIRGSRTPLAFHITFQLPQEEAEALIRREALPVAPEDVHGLYLNCRFRAGTLQITSGTSISSFDPGKTLERAWDAHLARLLTTLELI